MILRKIICSLINYIRSKSLPAKIYDTPKVTISVEPHKYTKVHDNEVELNDQLLNEGIRLQLFNLIASDCKMYSTLYRKKKGVVRKDSVGVRINGIRQHADVLVISNFYNEQMRSIGKYFRLGNKIVFECALPSHYFNGLTVEEFGTYMLIQFYRENYE